jgi:hypothetical protein
VLQVRRFEHYEVILDETGRPIELGRGAMGVTYKAFDVDLRCPVTLKVISERRAVAARLRKGNGRSQGLQPCVHGRHSVLRPKRRQLGPFRAALALRQEIPARRVGKGIGHFFGALQIDAFIDKGEFKKQIDDWIQVFGNAKTDPGTNGPLVSGDPEREAEAIRCMHGIPVLKPVVDDLLDISRKTGIPFSATPSAA